MTVDLDWLTDRISDVLRWQLNHPMDAGGPDVPIAGQRVWSIFLDLSATRGSTGFGPAPITYSEMEAWSRMRREPIRPFELTMLRAIDHAFLRAAAGKGTGEVNESQPAPKEKPTLGQIAAVLKRAAEPALK